MANPKIKWNMGTFVAIGNQVNAEICGPLGDKVAAAASSALAEHHPELDAIHIFTDTRGEKDWAHTMVINGHPHAMAIESKHGVLARALGAA